MIMPFMTKFPASAGALVGKPTAFIDKIWQGWLNQDQDRIHEFFEYKNQFRLKFTGTQKFQCWDRHDSPLYKLKFWAKVHTIREDKTNRWKPGVVIDFFINARTKDMFRFAPSIPVVSTQDIWIHGFDKTVDVWQKDNENSSNSFRSGYWKTLSHSDTEKLARNDGFDSLDEFFQFFPGEHGGKIIHWTDLKY